MTTAELLGKVAQKCYEISEDKVYELDFVLNHQFKSLIVILERKNDGKVIIIKDRGISLEVLTETLKKLENIDETYKEFSK